MGSTGYSGERRRSKDKGQCLFTIKDKELPYKADLPAQQSVDPIPSYHDPSLSYLDPCPNYHRNSPIISPNSARRFPSGSRDQSPHDYGRLATSSRRYSYCDTTYNSPTPAYMRKGTSIQTTYPERQAYDEQYKSQSNIYPENNQSSFPDRRQFYWRKVGATSHLKENQNVL